MKNWTILFTALLLFGATLNGQTFNPTFTLVNPQIVNNGADFQFEVDMHVSTAGSYHARGQLYLNYNTSAFGNTIASNTTVTTLDLLNESTIFGAKYSIIAVVDNQPGILSITWESNFLNVAPSGDAHTEVPVSETALMSIRIPIQNNTELAGVSFNSVLMEGEQFRIIAASENQAYDAPSTFVNGSLPTAPLPLDLLTFGITPQEQSIDLYWTSANEIDFGGYELQRSSDGRVFEKLAWIIGKKEAHNSYVYSDTAVQPGSTYHYRLLLQDLDGITSYSKIVSASLPLGKEDTSIGVLPNPARGKFYVSFNLSSAAPTTFELYTVDGRMVYQQHYNLAAGGNQLMINSAPYPAGLYTAIVHANGQQWVEQVVLE